MRRSLLGFSFTAALLGAGVVADQAVAGSRTLPVQGTITSQTITGPACTSPIGRCFVATFRGTLQGSAEFVGNSIAETSQPGMMLINGDFLIRDRRGDMTCVEDSLLNTAPGSDGEFVFVCEISGGTGKWADASGYLQATGNLKGEKGSARYLGKVVLG